MLSRLAARLAAALEGLRRRAMYEILGDDLLTLTLLTMDVREIRKLDEAYGGDKARRRTKPRYGAR